MEDNATRSNFPCKERILLSCQLHRLSISIFPTIRRKPEQLLHVEKVVEDRVHVIKRFSGGGTVVVDEGTLFVTLICSRSAIPTLELYPRQIMSWTEQLYVPVFQDVPGFQLREHGIYINPCLQLQSVPVKTCYLYIL